MEVEILENGKNLIELKVDSITVAEVLRAYLNENVSGVKFASWRREHPSKPIIFRIESSGKTVKKAVSEAIAAIKKDADELVALVKKK